MLIVAARSEILATKISSNSTLRGLALMMPGASEDSYCDGMITEGPVRRIPPNMATSATVAIPMKILGFNIFVQSLDVLNVEIVIISSEIEKIMQYFQAVQEGKRRAGKSQMKMFEAAGFGMLTLTTKKVDGEFQPIGEEEFTAVINSPDGHVVIITDKDGFTKAQSKAVKKEDAMSIFKKLRESGIAEYSGKEIQIWSETRPTIQDKISE